MPKPWEKFQAPQTAPAKPWEKFKAPEPAPEQPTQPQQAQETKYPLFIPGVPGLVPTSPTQMKGFVRGAAETASLGHLPEIEGAAGTYARIKQSGLARLFGGDAGDVSPEALAEQYQKSKQQARERTQQYEQKAPVATTLGKAGGIAATSLLPGGAAARGGTVAKTLKGTAAGGGMGFAYSPGDVDDPLQARIEQAKTGAAIGGAAPLIGQAIQGVSKPLADWLMRKAIGLKSDKKGAGLTALEHGVTGTRGQMQRQVAKQLPHANTQIEQAVAKIDSPVSADNVVDSMRQYRKSLITPGGTMPAHSAGQVKKVEGQIESIKALGNQAPSEALAMKRLASKKAYRAGKAMKSEKAERLRAESSAYGKEIQRMAEKQSPELGEQLAKANLTYGNLADIQRAVEKDPSVLSSILQYGLRSGIGAGIGGYEGEGWQGALAGALISTGLTSPWMLSQLAKAPKAAATLGQAFPAISPATVATMSEVKRKK